VSQGIDAGLELRNLGLDEAEFFLVYMQKVAAKRGYRPYWKGRPYRGRSVHRKNHGGCFIVYVVETESDGARRVTLIYAGRIVAFANQAAIEVFVTPRLKDFFK
jgi:hypothetical protein